MMIVYYRRRLIRRMLQSVNCCRSTLVQLLSQREPNKCVLQCVEPPANHVWVPMQSFAPQQDEGKIKCAQCILAPCAHTSNTTGKKYLAPRNCSLHPTQIISAKYQFKYYCSETNYLNVFCVWNCSSEPFSIGGHYSFWQLMGSYASLNKLKLSSILVMIMADTLWLILSEKQGIIILWFSPILLHSRH